MATDTRFTTASVMFNPIIMLVLVITFQNLLTGINLSYSRIAPLFFLAPPLITVTAGLGVLEVSQKQRQKGNCDEL